MSWSSRKEKEGIFVPFILSEGSFFNICFFSMYSVLNTLSENKHTFTYHTFTYQKTLLPLFCLFLKSSKAFSVSLRTYCQFKYKAAVMFECRIKVESMIEFGHMPVVMYA